MSELFNYSVLDLVVDTFVSPRIRKELGLDAARAVLGHRNLRITDDYAELDQSLAGKAALKLG